MTTIDRNPDIDIDREPIPPGLVMIEGKRIMLSARAARIPYGLAQRRSTNKQSRRMDTVGILVRVEDRGRMLDALARKNK